MWSKKHLLMTLLLAMPIVAQDEMWVRQFGSPYTDEAQGVYSDGRDIYVAGFTTVVTAGMSERQAFVWKYDQKGRVAWSQQYGNKNYNYAKAVTGDGSGIYVVGYTWWPLPGQSTGGAYIRKYDEDGHELWTRQFGTNGTDVAWAVSADDTGIYVAGYTDGVFPGKTNAGATDAFVVKFDRYGGQLWVAQFGSTTMEYALGVAADGQGGVSVVGHTWGDLEGKNQGNADVFVRRLDSVDGHTLWTRQFGTPTWDSALAVAANRSGVYVAGETAGSLTAAGNAGGMDGFVRRYSLRGDVEWTRQIRTPAYDTVRAIAVWDGGIYAAGVTEGRLPGQESAGLADVFVRRYERDGSPDWTWQFGGKGYDVVNAISVRGWKVVTAGMTEGKLPGQKMLGQADAFVIALEE
jgi:hypothetical protein